MKTEDTLVVILEELRILKEKVDELKLNFERDASMKLDKRFIEMMPVDRLILTTSARLYHCIEASRCRTIGEVCDMRPRDWMKIKHFGLKSLNELRLELYLLGLRLRDDDEEAVQRIAAKYREGQR